ncbi:MAG: hypothetical protein MI725_06285 [Pirellulales bacterium]|nr:hypothetical protein [Pirellulales bacterium]
MPPDKVPGGAPDELQQAWQTQASQQRITFNADMLSKEVQRSKHRFQSSIFWRDVFEVGTSLLLIPIWFVMGAALPVPWTWYLEVPALIWVAGFILIDRRRHPKRPSEPGEPLLFCAKESLAQVEHQIWLLRNVFWWYLLPLAAPAMTFFLHVAWQSSDTWWECALFAGFLGMFLFVVYGATYLVNQRAVCKQLEPRHQDLLKLIASLEGEASSEDSDDVVDLVSAIAVPVRNVGFNSNWAENWNRQVPSWRVAASIILPTLIGAYCGLRYPIPGMGPVLFQSVVAAVIPFEIALVCVWLRLNKKQKQAESAENEPEGPVSGDSLKDSTNQQPSRWPKAPAMLILVLTVFLGIMAFVALYAFVVDLPKRAEHPKLSPFMAVRWQDSQPEVIVPGLKEDGEWHKLVSLNDHPVEEIVAFSKKNFGSRWQKRFDEDLVELLTRMGHPPSDTVSLEVQSLSTGKIQLLENAPMTEENRRAIKAARDKE